MARAGSGADGAGLGLDVLRTGQIESVIARIPRLSLKREILKSLLLETAERPGCRMAFLQAKTGLPISFVAHRCFATEAWRT